MQTTFQIVDPNTAEGRVLAETPQRVKAESLRQGQQLFAKIKKSSKYYQTQGGGPAFPVFIEAGHPEAYVVQGGPGGSYRLADVNLFVIENGREMRIS